MVASRTGLSPVLIRAWEQRYGAVSPNRSATKRRLYSEAEIERLRLLKRVTDAGYSIGQVARLPDNRLKELVRSSEVAVERGQLPQGVVAGESAEAWLNEALLAIQALDALRLDQALKNASAVLGAQGVLVRMVAPLSETIGEWWREGKITAAHEHFGTGLMRDFLREMTKGYGGVEGGPRLIMATPAGQLHEMGALLAGAMAANLGWRVTQLGASLPAAEIAGVARQQEARAVALSIVYPEDDTGLGRELELLREILPEEISIIAGGRAVRGYRAVLRKIGAVVVEDLGKFGQALEEMRRGLHE